MSKEKLKDIRIRNNILSIAPVIVIQERGIKTDVPYRNSSVGGIMTGIEPGDEFHKFCGEILRIGVNIESTLDLFISKYFSKPDKSFDFIDIFLIDFHLGFGRKIDTIRRICRLEQERDYMNCQIKCLKTGNTLECKQKPTLKKQLEYYHNDCNKNNVIKCIPDDDIVDLLTSLKFVNRTRNVIAHHNTLFTSNKELILQPPKSRIKKTEETKVNSELLEDTKQHAKNATERIRKLVERLFKNNL